uniref:Uncharacterized protein n=1 Tax=viral metagenome TaxID=1070528 RepID=A0A6C0EGY8_9ZZZZ
MNIHFLKLIILKKVQRERASLKTFSRGKLLLNNIKFIFIIIHF